MEVAVGENKGIWYFSSIGETVLIFFFFFFGGKEGYAEDAVLKCCL